MARTSHVSENAVAIRSLSPDIADVYAVIRANKVRAARKRVPTPTYEAIAAECGCCVKTVYNILNERTHAVGPSEGATRGA